MAKKYRDKHSGLTVHRVERLTEQKLLGIRLAVANATAFNVGPYSPYDYSKRPPEIFNGNVVIPTHHETKTAWNYKPSRAQFAHKGNGGYGGPK